MGSVIKQRYFASLSESDRAKLDRIIDRMADRYVKICGLASMCGTFYVVTNVWHWPFLLALTLGSALGVLLTVAVAFAPVWGVLLLAAVFGKKTSPAPNNDKP